jgi:hypothetical protein
MFAVLLETKPEDQAKAELIVCEELNARAEKFKAERTFGECFWPGGVVLSWIAFRKRELICKFEHHENWKKENRYKAWKSGNPGVELIKALQEGRLHANRRGLPEDLPPHFWTSAGIQYLFSNDIVFARSSVLELWPDPADHAASAVITAPENGEGTPLDAGQAGRAPPTADSELPSALGDSIRFKDAVPQKPETGAIVNTNVERLEIAKKVVAEVAERHKQQTGIVPNVREHTTEVMSILATRFPRNHAKRSEVERLAEALDYASARRQPSETTKRASKRLGINRRS